MKKIDKSVRIDINMKLLLIEHHRHLLEALTRYLTRLNHNVVEAFDGAIAVNEFSDDIDVIFVDSDIPRVSYREVIELLKRKKENLKVVVLYDGILISKSLLLDSHNIDNFLHRPFTYKELDEILLELDEKKIEGMTLKESKIKRLLDKGDISFKDFKDIISTIQERDEYIASLNEKITDNQIVNTEKGFKLVKKND